MSNKRPKTPLGSLGLKQGPPTKNKVPFSYRWQLVNSHFQKDKGKVFSCFSCGGGSTMGYKLAGFDVIGFNEIDPKMAQIYIANHNPKHRFIEPIQDFIKRDAFPDELYNLDILDGSPPCSSFSMSGKREKDWGKKKVFREGQAEQVLDTLFFDFIALAKKLQPKVVIAENVNGILYGGAIDYAKKIVTDFDAAGYTVKEYVLKAVDMGVPQRRERVFFIAIRKDLQQTLPAEPGMLFSDFPAIDLKFNTPEIPFSDIRNDKINDAGWTDQDEYVWKYKKRGDRNYANVLTRVDDHYSCFNSTFIYDHKAVPTISATEGSKLTLFSAGRRMNSEEMILAQSFPLDYDFLTDRCSDKQYVLGMSVPPLMIANIADRIYRDWRSIFK
jgi:DNA (cytosine-5)-methyltransferase 1